jgi:hypothetical protein
MVIGIILGYILGTLLAWHLSKRLLLGMAARAFREPEQRKWILIVGGIFGAISLAPSIFLAMMFGGLLGGSYDDALSNAIGMGDRGALLILAIRLMLVVGITVTINAAVGGGIGYLMARALKRDPSITD